MLPKHNRAGERFGRLTAIEPTRRVLSSGRSMPAWRLKCDCGNEVVAMTVNLTKGKHQSCGCLRVILAQDRREEKAAAREQRKVRARKDRPPSLAKQPEYRVYRQMLDRCYLTTARNYPWYGGKGVTVCERWRFGTDRLTGYQAFMSDMGPRPLGLTLDRLDPMRGYSPDNCRWATWAEQGQNKREHHLPESERDVLRRKRGDKLRGERSPNAKLNDERVALIKARLNAGGRTSVIAREFDISPQTISCIKAGRHWQHVPAARAAE